MSAKPLTLAFSEFDKGDVALVGGKSANLGEMTKAGFPVPPGFALTVHAYDLFLEENDLEDGVLDKLEKTDYDNPEELENVSNEIQKKIKQASLPAKVKGEVVSRYKKLSGLLKDALVAVRSSATAEDAPGTSFAGQQASLLNIKGDANVLMAVKTCWASLFTARSIYYRHINKIAHAKVKISVIIQKMVQSEVSGVMFTVDPVTNDKERIIIESVWGLGEMIVQGSVVPDTYVVQKDTFAILSKQVSDQSIQLIKVGGETKEVKVPKQIRAKQKITDDEIIKLAKIAQKLQEHYYFPQDVEWAKEGKKLFIVQTRPITTLTDSKAKKLVNLDKAGLGQVFSPILSGAPASPGIATGPVKIILTAREIGKVAAGDILVAPMTSPDFVPAMKKAAAIVTDQGGQTSHAAIVSRELGVPAVVGTKEATKKLKNGMVVSVDGAKGEIFEGARSLSPKDQVVYKETAQKTATHLYVNLGEPQKAREVAQMNVDGVGLLRAEFMIANIGIHPKEAIKTKTQAKFIDKLARDLAVFCKAFGSRPVVYRATDFKTNEYRSLPGGKYWEPEEPNPLLGFRGAFRYIANPDVFNLELQAIKKVRENYDNLWLMIPFCRSPHELAAVRRVVEAEGLFDQASFKFWMMVELPVNVISLEDFIRVGIDGVSIGSNDLTMLIQGTDRDNSEVAQAFDERSPAVLWAIKRVIKSCLRHGITASICGQAPSQYDELVEWLVKAGITSISINPDSINRVRHVILEAEKKVGKRNG